MSETTPIRPRIWPAVVIVGVLWLVRMVPFWLNPDDPDLNLIMMGSVFGPMVASGLLLVWWVFFSRVPWAQVGLGVLACVGIGGTAWYLAHDSMGEMVLFIFALPAVLTAWIAWLFVTPFLTWSPRFVGLLLVVAVSWGFWDTLRCEGTNGSFKPTFWWRWTLTVEEETLAAGGVAAKEGTSANLNVAPGDWIGFRGPNRDSILTGATITSDWQQNPPKELWRRKVGPGWSSFAVVGKRLYTQEQLGPDELVRCYDTDSGEPLWVRKNPARFTETVAGPGPRATPTYHAGKLYAQGATGILSCLDAATGKLIWRQDSKADSGAKLPNWGFAASPLVTNGLVITYGGAEGKALLAYDADKGGDPIWMKGKGGHSYCSPHPTRLHGVEQVTITTEFGVSSHDPKTGALLWEHEWPMMPGMARVTQPAILGETDVIFGTFFGFGTRRVKVDHPKDGDWKTEEVWTTKVMKPYYNDMVVYQGHLYGFDGEFFLCVDPENGRSKWKVRAGYGNGQVLLVKDQGLLLVLTETGELALVEATPSGHKELAKFQALPGKTWNHPVIAHGKLYVRNGTEMACFDVAGK